MNTLELFCGTKSFSKVAAQRGHTTFTVDNDPQHAPDLCADIFGLTAKDFPCDIDIVWASPPCQCFSVASIGKNWTADTHQPKTEGAKHALELVSHTIRLIDEIRPKYWFIENPRGMLRAQPIMPSFTRRTVTYCQYGDTRMKPTDIWTNCVPWRNRPACNNGDGCHTAAPRGSRSGTQGIDGAVLRGVIPAQLFVEIFEAVERGN